MRDVLVAFAFRDKTHHFTLPTRQRQVIQRSIVLGEIVQQYFCNSI